MEVSEQPLLKKAKESDGQGLLHELVLPVDVLLGVRRLVPLSDYLLMLARTTKALRSILMNRSSVSTWKKAIQNVSLPVSEGLERTTVCRSCVRKDLRCKFHSFMIELRPQVVLLEEACICTVWAARIRACKHCIETRYLHFYSEYLFLMQDNPLPLQTNIFRPFDEMSQVGSRTNVLA